MRAAPDKLRLPGCHFLPSIHAATSLIQLLVATPLLGHSPNRKTRVNRGRSLTYEGVCFNTEAAIREDPEVQRVWDGRIGPRPWLKRWSARKASAPQGDQSSLLATLARRLRSLRPLPSAASRTQGALPSPDHDGNPSARSRTNHYEAAAPTIASVGSDQSTNARRTLQLGAFAYWVELDLLSGKTELLPPSSRPLYGYGVSLTTPDGGSAIPSSFAPGWRAVPELRRFDDCVGLW